MLTKLLIVRVNQSDCALFRVKEVTINIYTGTMGKPGCMVILVTSARLHANEKQNNDTVITIIVNT